jgi:hypothetical protein
MDELGFTGFTGFTVLDDDGGAEFYRLEGDSERVRGHAASMPSDPGQGWSQIHWRLATEDWGY